VDEDVEDEVEDVALCEEKDEEPELEEDIADEVEAVLDVLDTEDDDDVRELEDVLVVVFFMESNARPPAATITTMITTTATTATVRETPRSSSISRFDLRDNGCSNLVPNYLCVGGSNFFSLKRAVEQL